MDKGWVKLHRLILENHFLMKDDNAFLVFTKLLLLVGKTKGQWAGGRNQLAEEVNMKPGTLYDVLKRLESQQMIFIEPNKRYSVITICKWKHYQQVPDNKKSNYPAVTQPQPNSEPTVSQHSNKKENKKKKEGILNLEKPEQPLGKGYEFFKQQREKIKRGA